MPHLWFHAAGTGLRNIDSKRPLAHCYCCMLYSGKHATLFCNPKAFTTQQKCCEQQVKSINQVYSVSLQV